MENPVKKPWENVPLNDIQPYPSNYKKIVIISYIFAIVFFLNYIFTDYILIPKVDDLYLFSFLIVLFPLFYYGIIALVLLYLKAECNRKLMLRDFIEELKTTIIPIIIILIIFKLLMFANGLNIIMNLLFYIILFFNIFFFYLAIYKGPLDLIYMHHPKARLHGIITFIPIIAVFLFMWMF